MRSDKKKRKEKGEKRASTETAVVNSDGTASRKKYRLNKKDSNDSADPDSDRHHRRHIRRRYHSQAPKIDTDDIYTNSPEVP